MGGRSRGSRDTTGWLEEEEEEDGSGGGAALGGGWEGSPPLYLARRAEMVEPPSPEAEGGGAWEEEEEEGEEVEAGKVLSRAACRRAEVLPLWGKGCKGASLPAPPPFSLSLSLPPLSTLPLLLLPPLPFWQGIENSRPEKEERREGRREGGAEVGPL